MKQMTDSPNRGEQGFTLVEVLVAIALFGILLAVLIPSITALLGINRRGEAQLTSATQAQQVVESVKGAWQNDAFYSSNCAPSLTLPAGVTAKSQPLNSRAGNPGTLIDIVRSATCPLPSATTPPAMRRIKVSAGSGPQATVLTLDVLRPQ